MDYNNWNQQNQNQNNQPYPPARKAPGNGLMGASFVLGIAAIVSAIMMTVYLPFILGGISIVLALLSKGYENKMAGSAKAGIVCAVVGLVLNVLVVSVSLYTVFTDARVFRQFDSMYEQFYGDSFSDTYKELTGKEFPIPW